MSTTHKCPLCNYSFKEKTKLYEHINFEHSEELQGLSPAHLYFNYRNRARYSLYNMFGKSVVSEKPTIFDEVTETYQRFADQADKDLNTKTFESRMMRVYGKKRLTDDIEKQKEMLHNRKIAGEYTFTDGGKIPYIGSYEKRFLEHLDLDLHISSNDVIADPLQMVVTYDDKGVQRQHLPDFYVIPMECIINIKNDSKPRKDLIEREYAQDRAIVTKLIKGKGKNRKYLKIVENNFKEFDKLFFKMKAE
jgi:hypothetical protein